MLLVFFFVTASAVVVLCTIGLLIDAERQSEHAGIIHHNDNAPKAAVAGRQKEPSRSL